MKLVEGSCILNVKIMKNCWRSIKKVTLRFLEEENWTEMKQMSRVIRFFPKLVDFAL